jgi:colanic acid/amylovoran biosynthesis glycosyltransferase
MVARPSLCIVEGSGPVETFVRAHADGLPANVTLIHDLPPRLRDRPILSQSLPSRACRKALRVLQRREWEWEITSAYLKVFRRARPKAVLAEFGQSGVVVLDACRRMDLPLIVHFHGADISKHQVLRTYGEAYRVLFRGAGHRGGLEGDAATAHSASGRSSSGALPEISRCPPAMESLRRNSPNRRAGRG